jgi:hypothetical protein
MAEGTECGNMEKKMSFPTFSHHGDDEDDACIYEQDCNLRMAKNWFILLDILAIIIIIFIPQIATILPNLMVH